MSEDLPLRLARAITLGGPIPLSQFMAAANSAYYGSRIPLGVDGDFVTAPEVSQMFGEIVGAWACDLWQRAGRPDAALVELGPGRGTLCADVLRVARRAGWEPAVHLVETSRTLRAEQATRVPMAQWHDTVDTLPDHPPLIVLANEFFDALPIEQLVHDGNGWRQRLVACQDTLFLPVAGPAVPDALLPEPLRMGQAGQVYEVCPAGVAVMRGLAGRLVRQGGAMAVIDYGHQGPLAGETLQAVRGHAFANPFEMPGGTDLSAHVDFTTLAAAALSEGARAHGPVTQRDFLGALGLPQRAAALVRANPAEAEAVTGATARLMGEEAMGTLFKVLAITAPEWPEPAGL